MPSTETKSADLQLCSGCGHSLAWHFRDVTGVARCNVVHRGVTERGIIGLPWERHCECADFIVPLKPPSREEVMTEAQRKKFQDLVKVAFSTAQKACDDYSRPEGVMGGPCLHCGRSQPEHVHR